MRTRMYGGVRGRKTKAGGKPTFVFLLLDFIRSRCAFLCSDYAFWLHPPHFQCKTVADVYIPDAQP